MNIQCIIGRTITLISLLSLALPITGCATSGRFVPDRPSIPDVRTNIVIVDGVTGDPLTWSDMMIRVGDADIVMLGETHDDYVGHAVQRAILEDAVKRSSDVALSMEMLDRSEQAVVDDYLADLIDRTTFLESIASTKWITLTDAFLDGRLERQAFTEQIQRLGWPDWRINYQPIIDVTKAGGGRVVAANAPWARYSRLIREADGYHGFDTMTPAQRALVEVPAAIPEGRYKERFWEFMTGHKPGEAPAAQDGEDDGNAHGGASDEAALRGFRIQLLYDATMADSIVDAYMAGASTVIHLVGQFHSDFEGGTLQLARDAAPSLRYLNISLQPREGPLLTAEDEGRADLIIFTR